LPDYFPDQLYPMSVIEKLNSGDASVPVDRRKGIE
jgi:hypothetical protein